MSNTRYYRGHSLSFDRARYQPIPTGDDDYGDPPPPSRPCQRPVYRGINGGRIDADGYHPTPEDWAEYGRWIDGFQPDDAEDLDRDEEAMLDLFLGRMRSAL